MKNIMIWIMLLLSITYTDAQNGKSPRKDYAKLANYDESKVPQYTLPSVLMCHDGEMVQTKEQWEQKRRPEILNLFTTYMFGKAPVLKHKLPCTVSRINEKALNGRATRKEITIYSHQFVSATTCQYIRGLAVQIGHSYLVTVLPDQISIPIIPFRPVHAGNFFSGHSIPYT